MLPRMVHVYHVCSIKNNEGINSVINEGVVMDLGTAFEKNTWVLTNMRIITINFYNYG